jgi:hypothetical protein
MCTIPGSLGIASFSSQVLRIHDIDDHGVRTFSHKP